MNTIRLYTSKRWIALAVIAGISGSVIGSGAILAAGAGSALSVAGGLILGGTLTALVLTCGLLFRKMSNVDSHIEEYSRQMTAWVNVRPLLSLLPVNIGGWAMDPLFAETIVMTILEMRPRLVLECGSGSSTVLIAACLAELGGGRVVSLDHESQFAEQTRQHLALRGLDHFADVMTVPLTVTQVDGEEYRWYDFDPAILSSDIDLLVVDGPPGAIGANARYPAVPVLFPHLSMECVVLMDDGGRPDETKIAGLWGDLLGVPFQYIPGGKGGWIMRRLKAGIP